MLGRDPNELREVVLLALGCVITAVWVLGVVVQVIFPTHVLPTEVHGVMLVLVPILFGGAAWTARKQNGNGNGGK